MALDPVPFFVGGGAEHSPEVVRQSLHDSSSGAEGISSNGSMRVQALSTPGTSVRVAPGGGLLLNRYPGGSGQTYAVRNISETNVAIPATDSSGGATRYVVARISDPQYGGAAPLDPVVGPYTSFEVVSSVTGLAYPFVVLAKIVQPASTATITQAMITDLREMANPRRQRDLRTKALTVAVVETLTTTVADGESWPNAAQFQVAIPVWATRVRVIGTWAQIAVPASSADYGKLWVRIGNTVDTDKFDSQLTGYNFVGTGNAQRQTLVVADDLAVPATARGTTKTVHLRGRRDASGLPSGQRIKADEYSSMIVDLEFLEAPSEDA